MEMLIFIGLQGSGKSSFYHSYFSATHVHISKDNFRNASNRERRQGRLIDEAFAAGHSIVVDNTNASRVERGPALAQGRAAGARIIGYYFSSKIADCLSRNNLRHGKARVPDIAIFATAKRLELPLREEGFDELYYVSLDPPMNFNVVPWEESA